MFSYINDNTKEQSTYSQLRIDNPGPSLAVYGTEVILSVWFFIHPSTKPSYDVNNQYVNEINAVKIDGKYYRAYEVVDMTVEEITAVLEKLYAEQVAQVELLVKAHIQLPIDNYNKLVGTNFESVYNCTTYISVSTYPHQKMCIEAVNYNALIWDESRKVQIGIAGGSILKPETGEEFIALLSGTPVFNNNIQEV